MATRAANQPFQQPIAPVAGFTPFQQLGFGETLGLQGMAQPYFNTGQAYLQESAAPVTGADVANYYNPMAANVTAQMQNIFGRQMSQATGQATQAAGGVGADRIGVAQANLANQQGLAAGQTYAGLYQQALQAAEQQKQMAAGAGFGIAQMGPAAQGAQLQGIGALMGAGAQQQGLTQQQLNAIYQNQLAHIAYPFQTAQYLAGITGGLAPAMGGTTTGQATTTYPTPSPLAQGLGLGTAGIGMMGSLGALGPSGAGFAGMGGWEAALPMLMANRGGRIMADGGGLDDIQPPMGAQAPGAMPIKGSPIPMISLQPGAGKSGPGGQWMTFHDLPMQPPGMPQNKQGMAGTAGDIAAATKFLDAMGGEAQGGAVDPMLAGQGYQSGGELGEVFEPSFSDRWPRQEMQTIPPPSTDPITVAGEENATPLEQYTPVPMPMARPASAPQAAPAPPPSDSFTSPLPRSRPMGADFAIAPSPSISPEQLLTSSAAARPIADFLPGQPALLERSGTVTRGQETWQPGTPGKRDPYQHVERTYNARGQPQEALGAYGIMDFNLGRWSKEAFGREVTPQEFLANPKLQDALYRYKMGDYIKRFGVEGAGRAWLGGEGGVNAPMASDPFGTRVGDYGRRFAEQVGAAGDTRNMVAGPGAPPGGATPASLEPAPPQGPMGSTDFREPYPDALNRDWGQRATRSPWMSLVKAGAQMATSVGPIGSVIGQGIKAGAGELEEQRKALTGEEAINLKAKALHEQAQYHLEAIAARKENRLVRLQALSGLHPADIVKIQQKVRSDPVWSLRPDEEQHAEVERQVIEAARLLREHGGSPGGGGAPTATAGGEEALPLPASKSDLVDGKTYNTKAGPKKWDASKDGFV